MEGLVKHCDRAGVRGASSPKKKAASSAMNTRRKHCKLRVLSCRGDNPTDIFDEDSHSGYHIKEYQSHSIVVGDNVRTPRIQTTVTVLLEEDSTRRVLVAIGSSDWMHFFVKHYDCWFITGQ